MPDALRQALFACAIVAVIGGGLLVHYELGSWFAPAVATLGAAAAMLLAWDLPEKRDPPNFSPGTTLQPNDDDIDV